MKIQKERQAGVDKIKGVIVLRELMENDDTCFTDAKSTECFDA